MIDLVDGQPIRFGADGHRGVVMQPDGQLKIVAVADVGEDAILVHDANRDDPSLAFALARLSRRRPLADAVRRVPRRRPWPRLRRDGRRPGGRVVGQEGPRRSQRPPAQRRHLAGRLSRANSSARGRPARLGAMGTVHPCITPPVAAWIGRQHMFTVATAPLAADGHVNVSPKGLDSLRILDELTVAYLDYTGSGAETIAHVRENGRITLMWSAFEGPPRIVRVHGRGEVLAVDDARVAGLFDVGPGRPRRDPRARRPGERPCGYAVPLYEYVGQRTRLVEWAAARSRRGARRLPGGEERPLDRRPAGAGRRDRRRARDRSPRGASRPPGRGRGSVAATWIAPTCGRSVVGDGDLAGVAGALAAQVGEQAHEHAHHLVGGEADLLGGRFGGGADVHQPADVDRRADLDSHPGRRTTFFSSRRTLRRRSSTSVAPAIATGTIGAPVRQRQAHDTGLGPLRPVRRVAGDPALRVQPDGLAGGERLQRRGERLGRARRAAVDAG